MIRPITIVTFLMACGSGLYLYQSKHEVQLLDRTIEKSVHDTNALREQSRLLAAEWTMLNDPERLRQFSDTYLSLKTIDPRQFTSLNDLDNRLPAPRIETPAPAPESDETPVALDGATPAMADAETSAEAEVLPVPPIPTVRPAQVAGAAASPMTSPVASPIATSTHPAESRVALSRPVAAPVATDVKPDVRPTEAKRVAEARQEVRTPAPPAPRPIVLAAPRPQPVYAPPAVPAPMPYRPMAPAAHIASSMAPAPASVPTAPMAPYSGSLLGMARGSMPPAPRPMPVNATYNAN